MRRPISFENDWGVAGSAWASRGPCRRCIGRWTFGRCRVRRWTGRAEAKHRKNRVAGHDAWPSAMELRGTSRVRPHAKRGWLANHNCSARGRADRWTPSGQGTALGVSPPARSILSVCIPGAPSNGWAEGGNLARRNDIRTVRDRVPGLPCAPLGPHGSLPSGRPGPGKLCNELLHNARSAQQRQHVHRAQSHR